MQQQRKGAITVAAVFMFISGGISLIIGLVVPFLLTYAASQAPEKAIPAFIGILFFMLGCSFGIFSIFVGVGLLNLKKWAAISTMVLGILGMQQVLPLVALILVAINWSDFSS